VTAIGLEPEGATPLDPDEAEGLLPSHITTRGELNAWEAANIVEGIRWLETRRSKDSILLVSTLSDLHRQMFSETWDWAGQFRRTDKNIGVHWVQIPERTRDLVDDVVYQIEKETFAPDELAARFHHRLVSIHLFPNGNGRHARLAADVLLRENGCVPFSWGSASIDQAGEVRSNYLAALRAADDGDYVPLVAFARR
jgi:Fic-DOC domain mobile mystery protein B